VDQAQLELQLKVWKELAISKQMLMRTATDALKLDPNSSQDELKDALEKVIKQITQSELDVIDAQKLSKRSVAEVESRLSSSVKAENAARATATELQATLDRMTAAMAEERVTLAKEIQKSKERLLEKEKALKAINTALADTPENVLKKMNVLKKQKLDEATARQQIETSFSKLRTEKNEQDKKLADATASTEKLVTRYRDLHESATKLREQLEPLAKDVAALPTLDDDLLEEIANPGAKKDKDSKNDKSGKKKK
jgi:colicin import membrane protein